MIQDSPETLSTFVLTKAGEPASRDELDAACSFAYDRGFKTKSLCPQIGQCMIHIDHNEMPAGDGIYDVHEYQVVCDPGCPLLIQDTEKS